MKRTFFNRYQSALLTFLDQGMPARLQPARGIGQHALAAGVRILEMAKLHEQILVSKILPGRPAPNRARLIRLAGIFFTEAIAPMEKIAPNRKTASVHLNQVVEMLSQRTVELAATNLELTMEINQRRVVEESLKKSRHHYSELLAKSDQLQNQLRQLSRQILSAHEDERKRISRELHDVIAQTLAGINVRLTALKKQASVDVDGLERSISQTQQLVEKSVNIVHQFARELRPALLDDLGLIPALHAFLKTFGAQTGLRSHLIAFGGVEKLDTASLTVLFRVAQEALTNVARHAKAGRVEVRIQKIPGNARMEIKDDGKSFPVERVLRGEGKKRLGLLGMRERVEMVGGTFCVESAPGCGTTVRVEVPFGRNRKKMIRRKSVNAPLKCA